MKVVVVTMTMIDPFTKNKQMSRSLLLNDYYSIYYDRPSYIAPRLYFD